MKNKPGILGMSQKATEWYLEQIPRAIREETPYFPCDFTSLNELMPNPNQDLLRKLRQELEQVQGVSHIMVPNISIHHSLDLLKQQETGLPNCIHPIDLLIRTLENSNTKELVIFGTVHSMKPGYISEKLKDQGITCHFPDAKDIEFLDQFRRDVYSGTETQDQLTGFRNSIDKYAKHHFVALCCTELSMKNEDDHKKLIDLARLQIEEFLRLFKPIS